MDINFDDKISNLNIDGGGYLYWQSSNFEKSLPGCFGVIKPVGYCMIGQKMKKIIILIPVYNDWKSL